MAAKDEDGRKVVGGGSKSKGEKSAAKKSKLESGDEVRKGDNAPSREKSKIPMKLKRGADGGMGQGFLSGTERSSLRLQPRKDVPMFQKEDLAENGIKRIVGEKVNCQVQEDGLLAKVSHLIIAKGVIRFSFEMTRKKICIGAIEV